MARFTNDLPSASGKLSAAASSTNMSIWLAASGSGPPPVSGPYKPEAGGAAMSAAP